MSIETMDYGFGVIKTREKVYTEQYVNELIQQISKLEEQLQNAIIPKFKVGQIVYTFNKSTNCIYEICIKTIRIERHEFSQYNHMIYFAERLEDKHFYGYFEEELFLTKEEILTMLESINK